MGGGCRHRRRPGPLVVLLLFLSCSCFSSSSLTISPVDVVSHDESAISGGSLTFDAASVADQRQSTLVCPESSVSHRICIKRREICVYCHVISSDFIISLMSQTRILSLQKFKSTAKLSLPQLDSEFYPNGGSLCSIFSKRWFFKLISILGDYPTDYRSPSMPLFVSSASVLSLEVPLSLAIASHLLILHDLDQSRSMTRIFSTPLRPRRSDQPVMQISSTFRTIGCAVGNTYTNPNLISTFFLGPYSPIHYYSWVLRRELSLGGLLSTGKAFSYLTSMGISLISNFTYDLSLTSLPSFHLPVKESTFLVPLLQRAIFPDWGIPFHRPFSPLEYFQSSTYLVLRAPFWIRLLLAKESSTRSPTSGTIDRMTMKLCCFVSIIYPFIVLVMSLIVIFSFEDGEKFILICNETL